MITAIMNRQGSRAGHRVLKSNLGMKVPPGRIR